MSSIDFGPTFTVLFTTQRYFHLAKIASIPPKKPMLLFYTVIIVHAI